MFKCGTIRTTELIHNDESAFYTSYDAWTVLSSGAPYRILIPTLNTGYALSDNKAYELIIKYDIACSLWSVAGFDGAFGWSSGSSTPVRVDFIGYQKLYIIGKAVYIQKYPTVRKNGFAFTNKMSPGGPVFNTPPDEYGYFHIDPGGNTEGRAGLNWDTDVLPSVSVDGSNNLQVDFNPTLYFYLGNSTGVGTTSLGNTINCSAGGYLNTIAGDKVLMSMRISKIN